RHRDKARGKRDRALAEQGSSPKHPSNLLANRHSPAPGGGDGFRALSSARWAMCLARTASRWKGAAGGGGWSVRRPTQSTPERAMPVSSAAKCAESVHHGLIRLAERDELEDARAFGAVVR